MDVFEKLKELKDEIDDEERMEKRQKNENIHADSPMTDNNDEKFEPTIIFNKASFEIEPQEKICICGAEDDGKSMFLFSIMGETELMSGDMKMNGSMGFLSLKRAAFVSGTVRDNITLYGNFNAELYREACRIGCLNTERMPGDDFMLVAEGGSNLFAKEKMQIMVARLIYQNQDIFLIDDFFDYLTPARRTTYFNNIYKHCVQTKKTFVYVSAFEN